MAASPTVELLYFEGCPNHHATRALIERIAADEGAVSDIQLVEVTSPEQAEALRFLGSPSVRVNGTDVEPGAGERDTFVLACRVYRTEAGLSGQPPEEWVRAAFRRSQRPDPPGQ